MTDFLLPLSAIAVLLVLLSVIVLRGRRAIRMSALHGRRPQHAPSEDFTASCDDAGAAMDKDFTAGAGEDGADTSGCGGGEIAGGGGAGGDTAGGGSGAGG